MPKTFVIADIHGAFKALKQCLERSEFDYEKDTLIQLGDIADGWNEVYECVEELLKIKNLISIKGNHDDWFHLFIETYAHPAGWKQGGLGTLISYLSVTQPKLNPSDIHYMFIKYGYNFNRYCPLEVEDIPLEHKMFFAKQRHYYIDEQNRLFVHGGFDRNKTVSETYFEDYFWDRLLWQQARSTKGKDKLKTFDDFKKVFIGHTHVDGKDNKKAKPLYAGNLVWNLDTGAGYTGKLTIMNVDTEEYWQSDFIPELYPNQKGR